MDKKYYLSKSERVLVSGAPEGADAMALADAARARGGLVVHIARDAIRAQAVEEGLAFFAPDIPILKFAAWDCLPYDRVSPSADVSAARMATLSLLARRDESAGPMVLVTTVNAVLQRTPPKSIIEEACFSARPGNMVDTDALISYLAENGYARASTVREPGDFAVRGGLLDIFPPGAAEPLRLDMFGDTLEAIRTFDPETQRSLGQRTQIDLAPATEALLSKATASRFRSGYVAAFGAVTDEDPVYEAVSALRKHAGMEHWLPLFYEQVDTLFDFLGDDAIAFLDHLAEEAADARLETITDYYKVRAEDVEDAAKAKAANFGAPAYKPLKPDALYLSQKEFDARLASFPVRGLSPFAAPDGQMTYDFGAKQGRGFAAERAADNVNVFAAVAVHIDALQKAGKRVAIAAWTEGSADRMAGVLADHSVEGIEAAKDWAAVEALPKAAIAQIVLGLEHGFETKDLAIIAEQDILGDRMVRRVKRKRAENFLTEAGSLSAGDLVVHVDHGIGKYEGLKTVTVGGAPHDCLELHYAGGDKLYLPVENIELLSRYGSEGVEHLDKLGGAGWQGRKARMKARIRDMAEKLIKIAAAREMQKAESISRPEGAYDEFCARFPYAETEDQENAIDDVLEDLAKGRPMDRLICGDVGFGKTEVALRAAFVAAMSGRQVAVIAPTTLLARQHYKGFIERFQGFPLRLGRLSRLVSAKEASETRKGVEDGTMDIVIGTHALLSKTVKFRDLGLLIVDEEQHFGVKHKERLKELRSDTHVLTLTATPIPRTLQLAMSGIRDLSVIATPPVDRLAVRTSVGPFDPVMAREALLREHYRGGQSFYVCPRISDLEEVAEFLREYVPEVKYKVAHGQMAAGELEDIMNAFYDGKFEVLVSTTIIESGLDIPTANTMIVHRADMFGLAQLYQIRGRVGRGKLRAYAYLTTPQRKALTQGAEKRLKVLQSLDTLGAGFNLASHDLDIRGGGNLLGEEQSGQVKEVGVELYQHMLEEAVSALREGGGDADDAWSPQINLGTAVLIPDTYVADLDVRMSLYRRLSDLSEQEDIDAFGAEMIDRFGPLPDEVEYLLQIVAIKALCRRAGVEKVDAGPKGAVIAFRGGVFANPAGLVQYISQSPYDLKIKPDQKIVFMEHWPDEKTRLKGARKILNVLVEIAEEGEKAAA
ncbi:MAG: transcription-repair coupling factor [Pseudomonadota bacterium]